MSWVCLKERGLCVIGARNAFGSCQRDGCDVTAARRFYDKFASRAKTNENHNQIIIRSLRKALFMEAKKGI